MSFISACPSMSEMITRHPVHFRKEKNKANPENKNYLIFRWMKQKVWVVVDLVTPRYIELRWGGESLGTLLLVRFTFFTVELLLTLVLIVLLLFPALFFWFCADNLAMKIQHVQNKLARRGMRVENIDIWLKSYNGNGFLYKGD